MNKTTFSTKEQLNKIIKFRQAVYESGFSKGQDALFELVDALIERPHADSAAEMSLSPLFRRGWGSVYKGVEEGEVDQESLASLFVGQVPAEGVQVYPLDSTMWAHPAARTLAGMVYGPSPTKALRRHSIVQGHEYSLLGWTAAPRQSWTPTITIERVPAESSSIEVGIQQVQWLCQQRQAAGVTALDVIVADGHYGNHRFFSPLRQERCGLLARLRRDRVLYGPPGPYKGRGRHPKHGQRFAFKQPESWGPPDEEVEFEDERWGQVRLRRWNNLHDKQDADTLLAVIYAQVHREREKPPAPLWLGYKAGHTDYPVRQVWSWFDWRWPVEPSIRFRKQGLFWTLPALQDSEFCDRWTWLNQTAFWFLYLARPLVSDQRLPWQKPLLDLTPARVKRAYPALFSTIGTPAAPPQTRGNSPGWPQGKPRQPKERHKPLKRGRTRPKKRQIV
jgi:hypothetical protein